MKPETVRKWASFFDRVAGGGNHTWSWNEIERLRAENRRLRDRLLLAEDALEWMRRGDRPERVDRALRDYDEARMGERQGGTGLGSASLSQSPYPDPQPFDRGCEATSVPDGPVPRKGA